MIDRRTKQAMLVTALGIALYVGLTNLPAVMTVLAELVQLIQPVIAGSILALFIHVPMNGIQKRLAQYNNGRKKPLSDKTILILSFLATVACIALVLTLVLVLLLPELVTSSQRLYVQVMERLNDLENQDFDIGWLEDFVSQIDLDSLTDKLTKAMDGILADLVGAVSSTVALVVTACFAVIVCIYISLGKDRLGRHGRKLVKAYLPEIWAERILLFSRSFIRAFTNFLTGQCTEAVILGILMFLSFSFFQLPYGSLVGVLTAVCAIIPYVGAFFSATISVFLTLLIAPERVIHCIIVYSVVQFVENQFIYPRVVGGRVGLPPLYTLVAAMIGGKIFGIMGIIFFIPLMAVLAELVKANANSRILKKETMHGKE